jgi:hypothetical protein
MTRRISRSIEFSRMAPNIEEFADEVDAENSLPLLPLLVTNREIEVMRHDRRRARNTGLISSTKLGSLPIETHRPTPLPERIIVLWKCGRTPIKS